MKNNMLQPKPHRIISIKKQTDKEWTFRLEADTTPDFGQFYMLSLPKIGEAPISASGRGDGYVEFTIRNAGRVTGAIFDLIPGNYLFLRGPYGSSFPVQKFEHHNLVVICSGTGTAPVLTMMEHFYRHRELAKDVHLLMGFRDRASVLFWDEISRYKESFNVIATLSREENPDFAYGRVNAHIPTIPVRSYGDDYNIVIVCSRR